MAIDPVSKNYITPVTQKTEKTETQKQPAKAASTQTSPAATFERTSSGAIHKIAKNDKEIAENIAAVKAYSASSTKTAQSQEKSAPSSESVKYSRQNPVNKQEIMDAAASLLKSVKNNTNSVIAGAALGTNAAFQKAELPQVVTKISDPVKEATGAVDVVG